MPQVTVSHLLAERAVSRVKDIFARADAIAEKMATDYGEDLIVQTQHQGFADPFHIFVQVKGTRLKSSNDGKYRIRLETGHLQRWVSHIYPVIVCIYDDKSSKVYAIVPEQIFSLWDLSTTAHQSKTVTISKRNQLTPRRAKQLIWLCRMMYLSNHLALAENREAYTTQDLHSSSAISAVRRETNLITLTFLKVYGIIGDDGVDGEFRRLLHNGCRHWAKQYGDDKPTVREVIAFLILCRAHDLHEGPLAGNLIERGAYVTEHFFRVQHPDEWQEALAEISSEQEP